MDNLKVYSASAGSGKTHSIANEYINLLFQNSSAWRSILAVTFTNKACDEMKSRIIEELHKIKIATNTEKIKTLAIQNDCTEKEVIDNTQKIFTGILHDYSFFSVLTIDSFFQKILRNFTKETKIQYDYELELDSNKVVSTAVDELLEQSNTDENLRPLILELVNEKMQDQKKWDFRSELITYLKNVIKSDYRSFQTQYDVFFKNPENLENLKKELKKIEDDFIKEINSLKKQYEDLLKKYNLTGDDFKGKSRSVINKILKSLTTLQSGVNVDIDNIFDKAFEIEAWLGKDKLNDNVFVAVFNQCYEISAKTQDFLLKNYCTYNSILIISKNLSKTRLINYGLSAIKKYLGRENKFLIDDVPIFLSEIANHNNASFIYEKTGTFYNNFLIDEFQDTSVTQWDSLKPLLEESLAKGFLNIIVGDLKQSIYGWRGGDWKLLAQELKNTFPNYYSEINLEDNWRSGKHIVEFNNSFFKNAIEILSESIKNDVPDDLHEQTSKLLQNTIYENIKQNNKKDFKSEVKIKVFNENNREEILENLVAQIEEIQLNKHPAGSILILVRGNTDGKEIANYILKYSQSENAKPNVTYDVISSDSLFINSNSAVNFIISIFKYLNNNKDEIALSEIYSSYNIDNQEDIDKIFTNKVLESKLQNIQEKIRNKLVYESSEIIINEFELNKKQENIPFLSSFQDLILKFEQRYASEISLFLEFWEEEGKAQNIIVPEKQNAINILTVHKAKGLAADFVLVPFCNWSMNQYNNTIWVSSNTPPFNALPTWAVNYDNKLRNSVFAEDFHLTKFKNIVEAFNILYVAFTRARKGLYISSIDLTDNTNSKISTFLNKTIASPNFQNELNLTISENPDASYTEYYFGETPDAEADAKEDVYINTYPVYLANKKIKIKSSFERDKLDTESESSIRKGIVFHKIFENILYSKNISSAVKKLVHSGFIKSSEQDYYIDEVNKIISKPFVSDWFSEKYKVLNESEIIDKTGQVFRPDRIIYNDEKICIIDYKFGEKENSNYVNQVKRYGKLLKDLNYQNIEIYIWYVLLDFLIKVDANSGNTEKIFLK